MILLHFTEIATILCFFKSSCMAKTLTDSFEMYNCYGKIFYSENVSATTIKSNKMTIGEWKGYPKIYNAPSLTGTPPHTIIPIATDDLFDLS
ncbi:putative secreted effector protein, partial [Blumeria graminis f. sp. tritici 96224]